MATSPSERRTSRIHELELKHRDGLNRIELIHRDEGTRRLKLKLIRLRDDNALLEDRLQQNDTTKRAIAKQHELTREELRTAQQSARSQEAKLKKQAEELKNLKVGKERVADGCAQQF
jgi:hypothetical protein